MLVLTRRVGETVVVGGAVHVMVVTVKGEEVRLGISAPASVRVDRGEVHQRRRASGSGSPAPAIPLAVPAPGGATCPDPGVSSPVVDPSGCSTGEARREGGRGPAMATIADVRAAYDAATGQWTGCNWPTRYGRLGLELGNFSSRRAKQSAGRWRAIAAGRVDHDNVTAGEEASLVDAAMHLRLRGAVACPGEDQGVRPEVSGRRARRFCAATLAREWEFAAEWLEEAESDARWAEAEAEEAVRAAEDEDWGQAVNHARRACSIETGYGAPRWWGGLKRVIEGAAR
jgi:carbon storage regulator